MTPAEELARLRDTINRVWAQTYGPGDDRTEIEVLEKRVVALADDLEDKRNWIESERSSRA